MTEAHDQHRTRIALLHVAPTHRDYRENVRMMERALHRCVAEAPDLVITPELVLSGCEFYPLQGRDFIREEVPQILSSLRAWARMNEIALLLGTPFFSSRGATYVNTALLINEQGELVGRHDKTQPIGAAEDWCTRGAGARPIRWGERVLGVLVCADASSHEHALALKVQGAEVLLSLAAWSPGVHAPRGEWERRSLETGLTLLVCNRTGRERTLDFQGSSSVVVVNGERKLEYDGAEPAILLVDVDERWRPLQAAFTVIPLSERRKASEPPRG
jgi:N-carbamoylputrescine amidase